MLSTYHPPPLTLVLAGLYIAFLDCRDGQFISAHHPPSRRFASESSFPLPPRGLFAPPSPLVAFTTSTVFSSALAILVIIQNCAVGCAPGRRLFVSSRSRFVLRCACGVGSVVHPPHMNVERSQEGSLRVVSLLSYLHLLSASISPSGFSRCCSRSLKTSWCERALALRGSSPSAFVGLPPATTKALPHLHLPVRRSRGGFYGQEREFMGVTRANLLSDTYALPQLASER
ncbi:hypothetical protein PYCCODRAFT_857219 [Trametes coccinea BRFM310]|uniref:Uncharacterized protein n=1 Tax=Trametes coccinea (strain BRFM310) TaxID=1353009 RepID=A0A1Y2IHB2_TRAC3|nr:hypothetical protein PYCCODRAFT_857219 [Trametes coccinea BRFM310]